MAERQARQARGDSAMEIGRFCYRFLHHSGHRVDRFGVAGRAFPMVQPQIQIAARDILRIVRRCHLLRIVALEMGSVSPDGPHL